MATDLSIPITPQRQAEIDFMVAVESQTFKTLDSIKKLQAFKAMTRLFYTNLDSRDLHFHVIDAQDEIRRAAA